LVEEGPYCGEDGDGDDFGDGDSGTSCVFSMEEELNEGDGENEDEE
jgi:hypothetical protein